MLLTESYTSDIYFLCDFEKSLNYLTSFFFDYLTSPCEFPHWKTGN